MLDVYHMAKLQGYDPLKHALIPIQEKKGGSGFKRSSNYEMNEKIITKHQKLKKYLKTINPYNI